MHLSNCKIFFSLSKHNKGYYEKKKSLKEINKLAWRSKYIFM